MRIANIDGRLSVVVDDGAVDVAEATADRFSADPVALYPRWGEFLQWASESLPEVNGSLVRTFRDEELGPPSPRPAQVFAIGANYREHLEETDFAMPKAMEVFSKFPTAITGPYSDLPLPTESVDWEAELVVVIGRVAHHVSAGDAWHYVAGFTVGQDFSERPLQLSTTQWGLAKSFPAFGPTGPFLVTIDELANPDDVNIECIVNGEQMQKGRTGEMIFSVPEIIAGLTRVCTLLPGDLIFTGTMGGVGLTRTPPRYLKAGDEVVTRIDGIGALHNRCVDGVAPAIHLTTTGGK
jgi:2,4-diketo-3-deoxy-L-fuconate hydrolase